MSLKNLAKQIKKDKKEDNKSFEEKFLADIDSFLVAHAKQKYSGKSRLAFRPSGYYKCMRKTAYFLMGLKGTGKVYPRSQRIFGVGTATHEYIQEEVFMKMEKFYETVKSSDSPIKLLPPEELPSFGKEGFEIVKQSFAPDMEVKFLDTRWTKKYPISAMVDGFLEYENKPFLFEFKTINTDDFEYLIEPLKDHIKQGALYALSTGIRNVMFMYMDKNTQDIKTFLVNITEGQLEWVRERLVETENFVLNEELPPAEKGRTCTFCEYKKLCDKNLLK